MATLKDVARETGLTVSTVSRVLNNRGYISDDARKKVADAMKKLNYHPNEVARSLQNKKSNIIGLLVPHIMHPYFAEMISGLENAAFEKGYKVFLFNTKGREDKSSEYVNTCLASRVEGIILCTGKISEATLECLSIPIIALERPMSSCTASVACDNERGAEMATEALIEAGCKKLLYIGNIEDVAMPADIRGDSFQKVCQKRNIPYSVVCTELDVFYKLDYYEQLEKFLDANPDVDGIFASSDIIAAQILQVCKKKGIRVPEDMKVVGFDDVSVASLTSPRLTTIRQPIEEMARMAIEQLDRAIRGEAVEKSCILPVSIVRRESV